MAPLLLVACTQSIKRQAHFLPLMEGQVLYSGSPRFISRNDEVRYVTPEMKGPPEAEVSRRQDGSVVVTWISTTRRPEKLIYLDSGVHPVEIPSDSIAESFDLEADIPLQEPVALSGFLGNTAFIRELIDLRPIP